jgi:hypothetical protein
MLLTWNIEGIRIITVEAFFIDTLFKVSFYAKSEGGAGQSRRVFQMDNFKKKPMRISFPFLLLPLVFLSGCIMETPRIPNEGLGPYPFISEQFDFVTSDFNRATFNAQRSAWQDRGYKNYEYTLSLSTRHDNSEDPYFYRCEVVVKEGIDPEVVWLEGNEPDMMIPLEGAPPEDTPSVYTMEGIYDYVFSVIENLAGRVKKGNEGFRVYIRYDPLYNIPILVSIEHLENGVWRSFRTMNIAFWGTKKPTEEEKVPAVMHAFDRGTFEQEYNAWKELDIRNYRYSLYIKDARLDESGGAATLISVRNGKVTQATNTSGEEPSLKLFIMLDSFEILP